METENRGDFRLPFASSVIVAVDPGETTGFAVYDVVRYILACHSFYNATFLIPLITVLQPHVLIIERFPMSMSLPYEIEIINQNFVHISTVISPSEWKPFMKTKKRKFKEAKNAHEKDAVSMIRYYLFTHGMDDIK